MGDIHPLKVGDKGRVYLGHDILAALKVKRGDYVLFRVVDGKVTVEKLK
jgi:bifunctional DNA-binding transcriptional regulator/antitoxin component of YhaV-PrlF toxin-antitoxin module